MSNPSTIHIDRTQANLYTIVQLHVEALAADASLEMPFYLVNLEMEDDEQEWNLAEYCNACADTLIAYYQGGFKPDNFDTGEDPDWETVQSPDAVFAMRGCTEGSAAWCSMCGARLDVFLLDYAVEDELEHFRYFFETDKLDQVPRTTEWRDIAELLEAVKHYGCEGDMRLAGLYHEVLQICMMLVERVELEPLLECAANNPERYPFTKLIELYRPEAKSA